MNTVWLTLTVRGAPTEAVIDAAIRCGWLPERPPDVLRIAKGAGDWRHRFVSTRVDGWVCWGNEDDPDAGASHDAGVTVVGAKMDPTRAPVLEWLEAIPFTVANISNIHPEWEEPPINYRAPSLGGGLAPLGWMCAFRGDGHERLVSRRWLEYGPWRLHRRSGDLSIVEFHDAAADAITALDQARPGHNRMGISSEGGYIQPNFVYTCPPRGFYDASTGLLKVVVHGRPLTPLELLEACALRIETGTVEPGPVRNVAYVFMEEDEARANLHELWIRGLECRAIRLGDEVRLDEDYHPKPNPPAWV